MTYPSMPPAPIFSGGRHLRVQVESVTSSTVRRMGSLVGAEKGSKRCSQSEVVLASQASGRGENAPMGMKGLELALGCEAPMPLTANTLIS